MTEFPLPGREELNDAAHPALPPELTVEMSRLYNAGFSLIPLGGGDGKKSIVRFGSRRRLPLQVVVNRMLAGGTRTYGIRLGGLLVVDVDTDTPEARAYVDAHFGSSPVRTLTRRGFHLYFRHAGDKPTDVHLPNIQIEFKSGDNSYVVAAGSTRPDGGSYEADGRLVSPKSLPWFAERGASERKKGADKHERVQRGLRHTALKKRARELALVAESFDDFLSDLIAFRDWEIEEPVEFADSVMESLALWFWDKREAGMLWSRENSGVFIHRHPITVLAQRGDSLALLLYNVVVAIHGHRPDREFALSPDGIRKSGRIKAGREQLYTAIHLLVELGLLDRTTTARGKRLFYRYRLGSPWLKGNGREGSSLTLVPDTGTSLTASNKTMGKVA